MNQSLLVTKRDGSTERINLDKIHRVLDWAAEGLNNVSISQVELRSHIQFYDGIKTADIHETIIKAAADLISREAPDYQYLAARLAIFHLRKKAYGQFEPPALFDHVSKMVKNGKYDTHLLEDYTEEEFKQMDSFIEHDRDMTFSYAAVKQLEGKYLVQNRVTGEIYESAQFLYIWLPPACSPTTRARRVWTTSSVSMTRCRRSKSRCRRRLCPACVPRPVSSAPAC
ncbi:ribonucleotide reductase of class Ia [Klebsiella michiganensis]|nr:ribonucleotide reductase of class Ia [Klebsiella michiganensis]